MGFAMDARQRLGTNCVAGILELDPRQDGNAANGVRRYLAIGVESGPFEARPIERNGPRDVLEQGRQLKALVCEHLIGRAPLGVLELIQQGQDMGHLRPRNRRTGNALDGRSWERRDHVITNQFLKFDRRQIRSAHRGHNGVSRRIGPVPGLPIRARIPKRTHGTSPGREETWSSAIRIRPPAAPDAASGA